MTTSDIFRIVSTVAITQAICDLFARRFVYSKDRYRQSLVTLERARTKRDKALALSPPSSTTTTTTTTNTAAPTSRSAAKAHEKLTKKVQRAEDDFAEAAANVSKMHHGPNILASIVFLILYRVLSSEYRGTVVAVLPFRPWGILRRITMRNVKLQDGFDIVATMAMKGSGSNVSGVGLGGTFPRVAHESQGCGFLFLYILSNMSVKFLVHKLLGTKPPEGADKGLMNLMDDPQGKKILNTLGMDAEELQEVKNAFGGGK